MMKWVEILPLVSPAEAAEQNDSTVLESSHLPEWRLRHWWEKLRGEERRIRLPFLQVPAPAQLVASFVGTFASIGAIGAISEYTNSAPESIYLVGSFGATAVLLYAAPRSPLAQPRNLLGGHVCSALVGVGIRAAFSNEMLWLRAALAVGLSILVMQLTGTLHPPGGATALIAVIGENAGVIYVIFPILSGALLMLGVALIVNNCCRFQRYPVTWW